MAIDLSTNFGGLQLRSPIIVGACPLTANTQNRIGMESAGAGAMILPSLFEEHVIAWKVRKGSHVSERERQLLDRVTQATRDALVPNIESYLSILNRAQVLSNIPIIASLHGGTDGDWLDFAGELQDTGASAIVLNVHHSTNAAGEQAYDLENTVVELAKTINESITIPLFLKLHPEYTSLPHLAQRLQSGVQGLILLARDPEVDIALDSFEVRNNWGLSTPGSISPTLSALMSVYNHCPSMPLAGNGGIGRPEDFIKVLLGGADAAVIVSAIYRDGPDVIRMMLDGLRNFMESHRMCSLEDLRARRPRQLSHEEIRLNTIEGLSASPSSQGINAAQQVIQCDQWGHPLNEPRTLP